LPSIFLPLAVKNISLDLAELLPAVLAAGPELVFYERVCELYRQFAVGVFLMSGDPRDLHQNLFKSARAFVHFSERAPLEAKLTSKALPFFDAIACRDLEGAKRIALASPQEPSLKREYEEDFFYVHVLMGLFLGTPDRAKLADRLDAWATLAVENPDPRLLVCRALFAGDAEKLAEVLGEAVAALQQSVATRKNNGSLRSEEAATTAHVSIELLAWLELATRLGLPTETEYPLAPGNARQFAATVLPASESWRIPPGRKQP
jgi:hypothetical protein